MNLQVISASVVLLVALVGLWFAWARKLARRSEGEHESLLDEPRARALPFPARPDRGNTFVQRAGGIPSIAYLGRVSQKKRRRVARRVGQ